MLSYSPEALVSKRNVMFFVLFWIFCLVTTCVAFGMKSFDHLFVYWKFCLAFCMEWHEQPTDFLLPPPFGGRCCCAWLLPYVFSTCQMCWNGDHWKDICHQAVRRSLPTSDSEFARETLFAAFPGMFARTFWSSRPALVSHWRSDLLWPWAG